MTFANVDGPATEYDRFPSSVTNEFECQNACLKDKRCRMAIRNKQYCFLKDNPSWASYCNTGDGCWSFKGKKISQNSHLKLQLHKDLH